MSGVFSMASHASLQYFPDETLQEQIGCAHFVTLEVSIGISRTAVKDDLFKPCDG
jgi:hypothetical protein